MAPVLIRDVRKAFGATEIIHGVDITIEDGDFVVPMSIAVPIGPIVNVDQSKPPFGNTRRLITDADVKKDANRAHSSSWQKLLRTCNRFTASRAFANME